MNKSKVRRAVVNLLYAILTNGGKESDVDLALFWNMSQEKEMDSYRKSLARALLHLGRTAPDALRLLKSRVEVMFGAMEGDLTTASLRSEAARYAERCSEADSALRALRLCLNDKRRETTEQLDLCSRDVLRLAAVVPALGEELLPKMADFPTYRHVLQPLESAVKRCNRLMEACGQLSHPFEVPEQKELMSMHRLAVELRDVRPAAEKLCRAVLEKRETLEATLESLVQHYSMGRLATVDRCILLVAMYELLFNRLGVPIVVSEATSLAHELSGGKSARFIHGIIGAAAQERKDR